MSKYLHLFISTPLDLMPERQIVKEVVKNINRSTGWGKKYTVIDHEYPDIGDLEKGIESRIEIRKYMRPPSKADIVVCIYWSVFGENTDGIINPDTNSPYQGRTQYELLSAIKSTNPATAPTIIVLRCIRKQTDTKYADRNEIEKINTFLKETNISFQDFADSLQLEALLKTEMESVLSAIDLKQPSEEPLLQNITINNSSSAIPDVRNFKEVEISYLKHIFQLTASIELLAILNLKTLPVSINDIYVDLEAQASPYYYDPVGQTLVSSTRQQDGTSSILTIDELTSTPLAELFKQTPGLLILGDPGSGKTTFLKHLIASAIDDGALLKTKEGHFTPLYASCTALADFIESGKQLRLAEFFSDYMRNVRGYSESLIDFFSEVLQSGRAVILFDGLDEVPNPRTRNNLVSLLDDAFVTYGKQGNKFVVTSRTNVYSDLVRKFSHLRVAVLREMEPRILVPFLKRWYSIVNKTNQDELKAETWAIQQYHQIRDSEGLSRILSNPLMLTMYLLTLQDVKGKSISRTNLYSRYINILADAWNLARGTNPDIDPIELYRTLGPIAYWLRSNAPGGQISKLRAVDIMLEYFMERDSLSETRAEIVANNFLEQIMENTGILSVDQSNQKLAFIHPSFEEFFAGRHLARKFGRISEKLIDEIGRLITNDVWYEVIVLALGGLTLLDDRIESTSEALEALVNESTFKSNPVGIGKWLAGRVLLEIGETNQLHKYSELLRVLATSVESKEVPLELRIRIGNVIAWLGDPRVSQAIPAMIKIPKGIAKIGSSREEIEKAKQVVASIYGSDRETIDLVSSILDSEFPSHEQELEEYWISKYPVTNSQYKHFLDDTNYKPPFRDEKWAEPYNWYEGRYPNGKGNHPVVLVSWYDAKAYCEWLTDKTGITFSLPSNAQWEKAARGVRQNEYPWGENWKSGVANCLEEKETLIPKSTEFSEKAFHPGATSSTQDVDPRDIVVGSNPVGAYFEGNSDYGICDMGGNVWEWTDDWYLPFVGNNDLNERYGETYKVLKGSSWCAHYIYSRCAYRGTYNPHFGFFEDGFRIVSLGEPTTTSNNGL